MCRYKTNTKTVVIRSFTGYFDRVGKNLAKNITFLPESAYIGKYMALEDKLLNKTEKEDLTRTVIPEKAQMFEMRRDVTSPG